MRVAADTNLFVCAEGLHDAARQSIAEDRLHALSVSGRLYAPVQTMGELFRVLGRKGRRPPAEVTRAVNFWSKAATPIAATPRVLSAAMALAGANGFDIWDATVLAASAEADCDILLSEDMGQGFTFDGCTLVNPFAEPAHPLLALALKN
jgi:predicted nucleic acid-binding protein